MAGKWVVVWRDEVCQFFNGGVEFFCFKYQCDGYKSQVLFGGSEFYVSIKVQCKGGNDQMDLGILLSIDGVLQFVECIFEVFNLVCLYFSLIVW